MQPLMLTRALDAIRSRKLPKASVALILGSGLGNFADELEKSVSISTDDIPGYPASTVEGHAGKLVFGRLVRGSRSSPPLLVFKGRVHYYESGSLERTMAPIRLAYGLGIRTLVITNAAGGINRTFVPGDLMLIRDVLSIHPAGYGPIPRASIPRSPEPFDSDLMKQIRKSASVQAVGIREGVYCWMKGPSYETAAEIRMMALLGADAVGMSTVPEVLEARNLGMKQVGISLISNMATGVAGGKLSHAEVTETGRLAAGRFTRLLSDFLLGLR